MVIARTLKNIQEFIRLEASAGIILFFFAAAAIILDNSPWQKYYAILQHVSIHINFGVISITPSLLHFINDGLMPFFFFLVGLEIKREIISGELNSFSKFALPGYAALGGMIIPALIYLGFNLEKPENLIGWAIPTATDIAFALGVLSLLGSRIPNSLKIFLTALAILDDLGAILIIAIFYTEQLAWLYLLLALLCLMLLFFINRLGFVNIFIYIIFGLVLWFCVLKSGIHATIAGVALAMFIPLETKHKSKYSPLKKLEKALHPWVAFLILPLFAFFNAGVSFAGLNIAILTNPIPIGIAFGLFFGKQIGVFGATWIAVKSKIAKLPVGVDWQWIYGIALICGIGFTMSLFIGNLAFTTDDHAVLIRLGVLLGSVLSGLVGYFFLLAKSA